MSAHAHALRSFARKLSWLLMFRRAVQWTTVWFFTWGVVVLALRICGVRNHQWLLIGVLGFVPLALAAVAREWRRRQAFAKVRAAYDGLNECGGVRSEERRVGKECRSRWS